MDQDFDWSFLEQDNDLEQRLEAERDTFFGDRDFEEDYFIQIENQMMYNHQRNGRI